MWVIFCPLLLLGYLGVFFIAFLEWVADNWDDCKIRSRQIRLNFRQWRRTWTPRASWSDPEAICITSFCAGCRRIGAFRRLEGDANWSIAGRWIHFDSSNELQTNPNCAFCKVLVNILSPLDSESPLAHLKYPILLKGFPSPLLGFKVYANGHRVGDIIRIRKPIETASLLNTQWVTNKIETCRRNHKICNESARSTARLTTPIKILLIDVDEKCLVDASSDYEYLALSYVRGSIILPETIERELEALKTPDSLQERLLSATIIADGAELVKRLGKRYLWVDAFCIVQDGPHKHKHLAQMDAIYSQALLTIVATSATDASCPLPGLLPGTRKKGATRINDFSSFIANRNLPDVLAMSVYETRGWTLQERVLSTRCLHLSEWEAVFECQESLQSEHDTLSSKMHDPDSWHGEGVPFLWPLVTPSGIDNKQRPTFDTYSSLVETYMKRNLSFSTDALNVFLGNLVNY